MRFEPLINLLNRIQNRLFGATDNKRFGALAVAILLMIMLRPFLESGGTEGLITDFLFLLVFLLGIRATKTGKKNFVVAVVLGCLAIIGRIHNRVGFDPSAIWLFEAGAALFFAHISWFVGWHIWFRRNQVDHEVIYAAICLYLLLGFLWTHIFVLMHLLDPSAFHSDSTLNLTRDEFFYFSYTTLTTVGYGDIVPASRMARSFSMVEALTGQLYIAILISRLVSTVQHRTGPPPP